MKSKPRLLLALLPFLAPLLLVTGCKPSSGPSGSAVSVAQPKYHCPMHPTVVSDKPGTCPICSMDLVPIDQGGSASADMPKSSVEGLAVVNISPEKRQVLGLKLGKVEKLPLAREIRTSARIVADETRLWRVTTKVEGWVERLFVAYTGQKVKKGDPLLTIYSPDLVSAQSEYLAALKAQEKAKPESDAADVAKSLVMASRKRLQLWDITDEQVENLARTGKVEKTLTLYAPATGVVLERNVLAGQKLMLGNSLMVIADLSEVWGDADIYQSDLPYIKEGMPLELSLPYWPGKIFKGTLVFLSPTLDEESRTLRARLEIPNSELLLKPGMFGDGRLFYELGEKLSIPASAVMVGARSAYAFRDQGDGHVVPVNIKIGARSDGHYELLEGLKEGDSVVVSANFLVDSESNLKAALEAMSGEAPPSPHQHSGAETASSATLEDISPSSYSEWLPAYLRLQSALAADDLNKAKEAATEISKAGLKQAQAIAEAESLADARSPFRALSDAFIGTAHKIGAGSQSQIFVFECPMAANNQGARWIQDTPETRNPYFGAAMLKCGETKEKIGSKDHLPASSAPQKM